jgi:hypothetical protein
MTLAENRMLSLLDLMGLPVLVEWFIWLPPLAHPRAWIIFPIWLLASFLLHGDTPKTLGWRADNLLRAIRRAAPALLLMAAFLLLTGLLLGQSVAAPLRQFSARHMWNYFAFCLLQQVALNSLFMNRLLSLVSGRWKAALLAGGIFGLCHLPNPVLAPLTFFAGVVMAKLFAEERNILPLALGQAVLGTLVWWAFPLSWHHGLRVGPGYFRN